MNAQQWLYPLLKMIRNQMNFKIVRKNKNGRGKLWATILSITFSAVALNWLRKGKKGNNLPNIGQMFESIGENHKPGNRNEIKQKYDKKYNINNFLNMNDRAVLAEFADELTPKNNHSNENNTQNLNNNQNGNNPKPY